MAVSEYSDTVMDQINKTHNEIMFLYTMLNDKQAETATMVSDLQKITKQIREMDVENVATSIVNQSDKLVEKMALMETPLEEPKEEKVIITPEEVLKATGNNSNYAIYGLNFEGCTLKGEYSTTPNYEVTTKTEKPFSVDIHTQGKDWVSLVSPTETKKGKEAITCVNCDYIFKEREVAALGNHNWGNWYYDC